MKKLTFGVIALAILIAVLTNPKKEVHNEKLITEIRSLLKNNKLIKPFITSYIKEKTDYKNYLLFSISGSKKRNYTVGLFGNIVVINKGDLQNTFDKPNSKKVTTTKAKTPLIKNWKQNYSITSIRTGFGASSKGWKPAVLINIKNTANRDISKYVKIRAVFYDTKDNKEVGTVTKYIATTNKPFLKELNKDILLYTKAYKGSPTSLRLKAKLYIENEFVKNVEIDSVELI